MRPAEAVKGTPRDRKVGHLSVSLCIELLAAVPLAYVVWRPVSDQNVLFPALIALALLSCFALLLNRPGSRSRYVQLTSWAVLALGLAGVVWGALRGAQGTEHQLLLWVGQVAIWGAWAASFNARNARFRITTLFASLLFLSVVIIAYIAGQLGYLPNVLPGGLLEGQGAGFNDTEEGSAIRLYGLSSLAAGAPLAVASLFVGRDEFLPKRWLMIATAVACLIAAMLAGRRAVAVVTLASPLLVILLKYALTSARQRIRVPKWTIPSAAATLALLVATPLSNIFTSGISAVQDAVAVYLGVGSASQLRASADSLRLVQARVLLDAWSDKPFFGYGLGATVPGGYQRNDDRPWIFELQYHQLLFNLGVAGAVCVLGIVVIGVVAVMRTARSAPAHLPALIAAAVACVSLLFANASNPYLQTYGHGWGIALVFGLITAASDLDQRSPAR